MKDKKKGGGKRLLALLLAMALCLGSFSLAAMAQETVDNQDGMKVTLILNEADSSKAARAAKQTGTLYTLYSTSFPGGSPGYTDTWGNLSTVTSHMMKTGGVYKAAYCIDQQLGYQSGAEHTAGDTSMDDINGLKREIMGFILANGFQWNSSDYWSQSDNDKWLTAQLLIWAAKDGHIQINKNTHLIAVDKSIRNDIVKISSKVYSPSGFVAYYDSLVQKLENARKIPSFCTYPEETVHGDKLSAQELNRILLSGNGSHFTRNVTDGNRTLSNWSGALTKAGLIPDLTVTANGNSATLTSTNADVKGSATVEYKPQGGSNAVIAWKYAPDPNNYQRFASVGAATASVKATLAVGNATITTGGPKIVKTAEDGIIQGVQFGITGTDGSYRTFSTDSNGEIDLSSLPSHEKIPVLDEDGKPVVDEETGEPVTQQGPVIVYTAQEINVPDRYVIPPPQSFTLAGNTYNTTGVEALQAATMTLKGLNGTADPETLFNKNLPNMGLELKKDGRLFIKIQDENGQKLGVCYALKITNGDQVYYAYTEGEYGTTSLKNFDLEQSKKARPTIKFIGYFKDGAFVATEEYRGSQKTASFDCVFDGTYFYPLSE